MEAIRAFVTSELRDQRCVLFGVRFHSVCTDIGKLAHDSDMRQFFLQSGYTIWFMYFIMAAETAGAIGLLLRERCYLPRWA